MTKYTIVINDYPESLVMKTELETLLKSRAHYVAHQTEPDLVFVIGGDGTFLGAVHNYRKRLDQITFVPIKFGGIGFYTNHNTTTTIHDLLTLDPRFKPQFFEYSLLQVSTGNKMFLALNEVKLVNNIRPLEVSVFVNQEKLETFRGSGLVFATPSGSTGFAKSAGGPVIFPDLNIFEMLELFPVSTNKFRTLNSPVIFSEKQEIKLILKNCNDVVMSVDTRNAVFEKEILINISNQKVKVMSFISQPMTKTKLLNNIFVLNDKSKSKH